MKQLAIVTASALVLALAVTGCDRRTIDVPTYPTQVSADAANRVLVFQYDGGGRTDNYFIYLLPTQELKAGYEDDEVIIEIGGDTVPLHYASIPGAAGWYANLPHPLGGQQDIRLLINGQAVLNTFVKPVNKVSAAFPASYDLHQPLTLNWAVLSGNQYQFVRAEAWHNYLDGEMQPYSSYVKQTAADARSHLFPADCISLDTGPDSSHAVLTVQQVNYKIVSRTAVMVFQEDSQPYPSRESHQPPPGKAIRAIELDRALRRNSFGH